MFRLRGLFGSEALDSKPYPAKQEIADLEDAIRATETMMDDDIETAEKELSKYDSAYHTLGLATMAFMRAVLGSEPEEIQHAFQRLAKAETAATEAHQRIKGDKDAFVSEIYGIGAEFHLGQAETQMMTALVAILSESLTESIKGFYKIRKAYNTLSSIYRTELSSLKAKGATLERSSKSNEPVTGMRSASFSGSRGPQYDIRENIAPNKTEKDNNVNMVEEAPITKEKEAIHDSEDVNDCAVLGRQASLSRTDTQASTLSKQRSRPQMSHRNPSNSSRLSRRTSNNSQVDGLSIMIYDEEFSKTVFSHPVDAFTHSGVNLQYGMLQLLLGLVPPTFNRVLSIVGFSGNSRRGLAMLWEATRFENIHGAVAGLVISAYYTSMISFQDIYLFDDQEMYPMERCKALLVEMRERYPLSSLWKLEECRVLAAEREIELAVKLYDEISSTPFKQLDALRAFERGLNVLSLHRYADTIESFLMCIELNDWSHAMYYYIIGSAHVELYRDYKDGMSLDATKAAHHAKEAEHALRKVLENVGKKRFMARQLPFDTLVARKVNKWTAKAKLWNIPLIDAIGVSPAEEMSFFWGRHSRLRAPHLQESLQRLAWSDGDFSTADGEPKFKTVNPQRKKESVDEKCLLALLRAHVYRRLGKVKEAEMLIKDNIIACKPAELKGGYKDSWVAPMARYELATLCWLQSGVATDRVSGSIAFDPGLQGLQKNGKASGSEAHISVNKARLQECSAYLEKVANWEKFDLDSRFGINITTAKDTIKSLGF